MKKIFPALVLALTFALTASAQTEYSLSLYDSSRSRVIPVTVYSPAKTTGKTGVVVFSHGYDKNKDPQSNRRYAYLNRYLAENGCYVISIQHELPDDPPMPLTGDNFAVTRMSNWVRGKANIMFAIDAFKALKPDLDWKNLTLIGHSNGGDMSMLCVKEHPEMFWKAITLDSRRMKMPLVRSPRLYTLRGCDYEADEGVLPTAEEQKEYGMTVMKLDGIWHRDFGRRGTDGQHDIIKRQVCEFVNGNPHARNRGKAIQRKSNENMKRRYLFFDIDGTLAAGGYGNTYIPESTKLALRKLREAGHFLCIATGRSQAMAAGYMRELGFGNMVSDGGYGVTIDNELLGITPIDREKVIALVRECERKGIPWGLQVDNSDTRVTPDGRFEEYTRDVYMKTRIVENLDPEDYPNIYKAYIACDYPTEHSLENLDGLPWGRFHKEYFFVEPCDKAFGIKRIMDHFGADYKDAVVFGDAINDMSMFTDDWYKVAMGNAIPELKAKADLITADVDDDGIYKACEKLGLFAK